MSSDIFTRIKSIISSLSFPSRDQSLKRRGSEDVYHPSRNKYSRVSDVFPRIIPQPTEDYQFTQQRFHEPAANMNQRRSYNRTSNTNSNSFHPDNHYAEIEYSDDEDDFVFKNPRHLNLFNNNTTKTMNSYRKDNSSITAEQNIPVIVQSLKSANNLSHNSVDTGHRAIINGHLTDIPALTALKPINRGLSATKSSHPRDSWHSRFTCKLPSSKPVPPLLHRKTYQLTHDTAGSFGSVRNHVVNGIDQTTASGGTKLMNGSVNAVDSSSRASSISQKPSSIFQKKKGVNTCSQNEFQTNDKERYMQLLQKIMPQLYKSKDIDRDQERLAQLAEARSSTKKKRQSIVANITIDDDDEPKEVIDLSDDDLKLISVCRDYEGVSQEERNKVKSLPTVTPVNSLKERLDRTPALQANFMSNVTNKYNNKRQQQKKRIDEVERTVRQLSRNSELQEELLRDKLDKCLILRETIVLDEEEEEEEEEFPEFTDEQTTTLKRAIRGPPDEVLVSKFNMNITRRDIHTLLGDTWLNDEVINFYMNLLMDRSEQRSSEGLPRVYSMNTFFVPRLLQSGHSGVKRWTRKVDIFSYDVIPVPVHVGQVHWCMAIINIKEKHIKYYDSMGTPNPRLLNALEDYLREESLDKRKMPFDTSAFRKESVANSPRQMNGSDCGVFSCMTAEYVTRNRDITFSQENMPYFRQKMIIEIVQGNLML